MQYADSLDPSLSLPPPPHTHTLALTHTDTISLTSPNPTHPIISEDSSSYKKQNNDHIYLKVNL